MDAGRKSMQGGSMRRDLSGWGLALQAAAVGAGLVVALGCSSDPATPPSQPTPAPIPPIGKTIGAAGGTVTAPNGAQIEIPAGALAADTALTITAEPAAPIPAALQATGTPYTFGPEGLTFTKPVKITLPFDAAKLAAGKTAAEIVMFTAPKDTTDFVALTSVVSGSAVTAETTHFSTFVAATLECAVACSGEAGLSGSAASCKCNSTCLGVSYSMNCPSGQCTCQNGTTATTDCTNIASAAVTFKSACGFLGAIQTEKPDAGSDAGSTCAVACGGQSGGTCECTMTCDGLAYRMDCAAAGSCSCKKEGQETKTTTSPGCTDGQAMCLVFVDGCTFPGKCPK
jgi:hypothetical protein